MKKFLTLPVVLDTAATEQSSLFSRARAKVLWWTRGRLTPVVAARRHRPLFRAGAAVAQTYLDMWRNASYDIQRNGELLALRAIAESHPRCVFDVGANQGDWSLTAARLFADAKIHAFEIVPDTAELLRQRVVQAGLSSVIVNAFGLSAQPGTVTVAYLPGFSAMSSAAAVDPTGSFAAMRERFGDEELLKCEVQTGDDYCRQTGIERIDFLKLDVEGLEREVLQGFNGMLSSGNVDVIQFEYGRVNATIHFLLADFYDLLDAYGYEIGKMFPDGVEFRAYDAWRDEDFTGPNYLAVRRQRADLIDRLSVSKN